MFKFLLVLTFLNIKGLADANLNAFNVSCEKTTMYSWPWGDALTCYMKTVTINSMGLTITTERNLAMRAIEFSSNKMVQFLPEHPAQNFPNLEIYKASDCAIEKIHKKNFKNLSKLKVLWITSNPLETITSDTFEDLTSLESLVLMLNQIKFMNGAVFKGLNNLKLVYLQKNRCIDEFFFPAARHGPMIQAVNDKCGFNEEHIIETSTATDIHQENHLTDNLESAKSRIAELQLLTHIKSQEIGKLQDQLSLKDQEINLLNLRILKLEEKVLMLSTNRVD